MLWGLIPKLTRKWEKQRHDGYPINPVTLGEHIRKRRMDLGLLQEDVAKELEVTTNCITNWENNRSKPQIQFFPTIIKFLGIYPFIKNLTTLGGQIEHYRNCHGLSHKKFGKLLKVDASTIGSWESNKHTPQVKQRRNLLRILQE